MTDAQKALILKAISDLGVKKPAALYQLIEKHCKTHGSETIQETMEEQGDPFTKHFDNKVTIHRASVDCEACEA